MPTVGQRIIFVIIFVIIFTRTKHVYCMSPLPLSQGLDGGPVWLLFVSL